MFRRSTGTESAGDMKICEHSYNFTLCKEPT